MTDLSQMKLGRVRRPRERKLVMLRDVSPASFAVPLKTSWLDQCGIGDWGMYWNDRIGDCTRAAQAHGIMQLTTLAGAPSRPTNLDVLACYERDGYRPTFDALGNPEDNPTDQGAIEDDVLADWQSYGMAGHQIAGFASIHPADTEALKYGIDRCGIGMLGLALPLAWQNPPPGEVLDLVTGAPGLRGTWGEHEVSIHDFDADGVHVVSWGTVYLITWRALAAYADEIDIPVSTDFIGAAGQSRSGLDLSGLLAARAQLAAA